jgi:superfamily II DNA helicase RecQ
MKCKVFKIHLDEEARSFEEVKFNKFLETVEVKQTYASIIGNEFWSILVFYEEISAALPQLQNNIDSANKIQSSVRNSKPAIDPPEPIVLNPNEEIIFAALREWRNARAGEDGLPPYMIAHNDSLMQIAKSGVKTKEELTQIKGFGEKRADKYGDEILQILKAAE